MLGMLSVALILAIVKGHGGLRMLVRKGAVVQQQNMPARAA